MESSAELSGQNENLKEAVNKRHIGDDDDNNNTSVVSFLWKLLDSTSCPMITNMLQYIINQGSTFSPYCTYWPL